MATTATTAPERDLLASILSLFILLALLTMPSQVALTWYGHDLVEAVSAEVGFDATPSWALQVGGQYVELVLPQRFDHIAFKLENPLVALSDIFAALAVLFALLHLLVRRQWHRVVVPPWPLWVLALALAVSGVSSSEPLAWGKELTQHLFYLLVAVALFAYVLHDEASARRWVGWWILATCIAVAWGLFFDPERPDYLGGYLGYVYLPPAWEENPLLVRAGFMSRTAYNGYLLLSLPIWYGFLLNTGSQLRKVGWLLLIAVGLIPILSFGAFFGLMLAFALLTALVGPPTLRTILAGLAIVGGFAALSYGVSERHAQHLADSVAFLDRDGQVSKRYLEWQASLHAFEESPLFGVGLGEYQRFIGQYYYTLPNPEKMEPDTYNLYLLLLVQAGIMAPLAWLALLFHGMAIARRAWGLPLSPYWCGLAKGAWAACFALLIFSFTGTVLVRGAGLAFALLWGLLARLQRELDRSAAEQQARLATPEAEAEWESWSPEPARTEVPPLPPEPAEETVVGGPAPQQDATDEGVGASEPSTQEEAGTSTDSWAPPEDEPAPETSTEEEEGDERPLEF